MRFLILGVAGVVLAASCVFAQSDWEIFLNSNDVTSIWLDADSVVWGSRGGVVCHHPGVSSFRKTVREGPTGLKSSNVTAVATDAAGRLWVGTADRGVCVSEDGSWRFHDTGNLHLLSDQVASMTVLGDTVAVGTAAGLSLFRGGEFWRFFSGNDWGHSDCGWVQAVAMSADRVLVGTSCGLFALDLESLTWAQVVPEQNTPRVTYDGEGLFWAVTDDSIYTYGGDVLRVMPKTFIEPDDIRDIGARGSSVWVVSNYGPARYDAVNRYWVRVASGIPTELVDVRRIRVGDDGAVWIGTKNGVGRLAGDTWSIVRSQGPASNYVQDMCVDNGGRMWVGTGYRYTGAPTGASRGLLWFDPDSETWNQMLSPQIPSNNTMACEANRLDGSVWVGFWDGYGIIRLNPDSLTWVSYRDIMVAKLCPAVYIDSQGNVAFSEYSWGMGVLSPDYQVVHYSRDESDDCLNVKCVTSIGPGPGGTYMIGNYFVTADDPCQAEVVNLGLGQDFADKADDVCRVWTPVAGWPQGISTYDFALDRYGIVWLGSGGGLGAYDPACDKWHRTNMQMGSVWDLEVDSYDRLWVACDKGVYMLEGHAVQWLDFFRVQAYDASNSPLDGVPVKAIEFDADGALWIGTAGGGIYRYTPSVPEVKAKIWVDVYPNPYLAFKDTCGRGIQFSGFKPGSTVRIYTLAGDLVREVRADRAWDARNAAGEEAMSGVYLYVGQAEDGGDFKGRLVIVR
jgi:ligand-binding sensor domain-containing protein